MKILYVVNVDWFFISHRLPLALEAQNRGYEVYVLASDTGAGEKLKKYNIHFIPWNITRSGTKPYKELIALLHLLKVLKNIKPALVHNVGLKSVIYGSIISKLLKKPYVNALAGMGFTFTANTFKAKIIRASIKPFFKVLFNSAKCKLILQNEDDKKWFIDEKYILPQNLELIKGSGVNLKDFYFSPEPQVKCPIICLPARMLWDKGVGEFVEAIKIIKSKGIDIRGVLLGGLDTENPAYIEEKYILTWVSEGIIEWWGHQTNMAKKISEVNIIVLPSYKEGLPKVLLEASAIGRAIITTDVVGCREVVKNNETGILVPPKNAIKIAEAIEFLLQNEEIRQELIKNSYERVKQEFTIETVIEKTFNLYKMILTV